MKPLIKILLGLGLFLIVLGAYHSWNSAHPKLTDAEQVTAALNDASIAVEDRYAARVEALLAPDFKWNETNRSEFGRILNGAFWQARDIHLSRTNEQTVVTAGTARTTGHFSASYKPSPDASPESRSGDYEIGWRKIDGSWKITTLRGGENIGL